MGPPLSISPLTDSSAVPRLVPPPLGFRPLLGTPRDFSLVPCEYCRTRGNTAARDNGLRYEAKVQAALVAKFSLYCPTPQVSFVDDTGFRIVRPDGVLTLPDRVVVFEIKAQHCPEAWWQLNTLYGPVLAKGTRRAPVLIEVCRSYDPAMPFPCAVELVDDLESWIGSAAALKKFGVVQWRM